MASLNDWAWLEPNSHTRLYSSEHSFTGEQLALQVRQLSLQLSAMAPQGKLAVCRRKPLDIVLVALACLDAGWLFQPISPRWPATKRTELALQTGSTAAWPATSFAGCELASPLFEIGLFATGGPVQAPELHTELALVCSTLLTSGSTGHPKAVSHRLEQHLIAAKQCNSVLKLDPSSCWLMSLPLYHAAGYAILMRCLLAQAAIALPSSAGVSIKDLRQYPVTHLSLVATQLHRLLQQADFNAQELSLTHIMLGGGPVPNHLIQQAAARGFELSLSYGMTETAAAIALATIRDDSGIALSAHTPLRIVNDEIQLRGQQLAQHYQLQAGQQSLLDQEGWFHTGDRGRIHQGKLYVEGRCDNRFISGGENIQPEIIEQVLQQHPAVAIALVVPIANPEYGQRPLAFIHWHQPENAIGASELTAWLQQQLPRFMCPDHYLDWPEQSPADQKPIRAELIAIAQQAQLYPFHKKGDRV